MDAALDYVGSVLGPRGQWPGRVAPDTAPQSGQRDLSPPLSALGALALLDVPGAEHLVHRTREHIALTALPEGAWRYYATIPPDTDDTAMCVLALGEDHADLRRRAAAWLASTVGADGLFPTWVEPGWSPVVDAVPNAHVVAVLGAVPTTARAIDWLDHAVRTGAEVEQSTYYPDALDLHVALTRAVRAGVFSLQPTVEVAAVRATARLDDPVPYRLAQAIVVASAGGAASPAELATAAEHLVASQHEDGSWPAHVLFRATSTAHEGWLEYSSVAITTALCAQALTAAARCESGMREDAS